MTTHHPREFPIILMTGTPGTGKSTHAQYLASASSTADVKFEHINVSELVKEKGFHEGWDEEWKTWIMDEDKVGPARGSMAGEVVGQQAWRDFLLVVRVDHHPARPRNLSDTRLTPPLLLLTAPGLPRNHPQPYFGPGTYRFHHRPPLPLPLPRTMDRPRRGIHLP